MRQSSVIFGTLLLAFMIYITMRGQLASYIDLFRKGASSSTASSSGTSENPLKTAGDGISNALRIFEDISTKGGSGW